MREATLDLTFAALADPTRRLVLERLMKGAATINEIAAPFTISLNAVSKHLKVLEKAGLIKRTVIGREHYCELNAEPLREAEAWMEHYREFWDARLDALEEHLQAAQQRDQRRGSKRKKE